MSEVKAIDEQIHLQRKIAELEAVVEQRNKMCSDYYEGHVTNMKRITRLEAELIEIYDHVGDLPREWRKLFEPKEIEIENNK